MNLDEMLARLIDNMPSSQSPFLGNRVAPGTGVRSNLAGTPQGGNPGVEALMSGQAFPTPRGGFVAGGDEVPPRTPEGYGPPDMLNSPWAGVDPIVASGAGPTGRHGLALDMGTPTEATPSWWEQHGTQVGRGLMGFGAGLMSTRPGVETFGSGAARGIQAGTQGYLAEGRRLRAEKARKHFADRAAEGGPNSDIYSLMSSLEPGQMVPIAQSGIAARGRENPYELADYRDRLARSRQSEGRQEAEALRQERPSESNKQMLERYRRSKWDSGARDEMINEGLLDEQYRGGVSLPEEIEAAILRDDQEKLFFQDLWRGINANRGGPVDDGMPVQ